MKTITQADSTRKNYAKDELDGGVGVSIAVRSLQRLSSMYLMKL